MKKFKEEPEEKPKENVKPTPASKRKGAAVPSTPSHSNTSTPASTPTAASPTSNGKVVQETADSSKDQSTPLSIDTQNLAHPTPPSTPELAASPTSPTAASIPPSPAADSPDAEKEPVLTEVQCINICRLYPILVLILCLVYLVKALKSFGGSAPLTAIQDYVSKVHILIIAYIAKF